MKKERKHNGYPVTDYYEPQLLKMLTEGMRYYDIAQELKLQEENVLGYIKRLRKKHGAATTPQLISIAYQKGLLKI